MSYRFHLDPIELLRDGGDEFLMVVRIACDQVIAEDEQRQREEEERALRKK